MLMVIHKISNCSEIEIGTCLNKEDVENYVSYHDLEPRDYAVLDVVKIHKDFFNETW